MTISSEFDGGSFQHARDLLERRLFPFLTSLLQALSITSCKLWLGLPPTTESLMTLGCWLPLNAHDMNTCHELACMSSYCKFLIKAFWSGSIHELSDILGYYEPSLSLLLAASGGDCALIQLNPGESDPRSSSQHRRCLTVNMILFALEPSQLPKFQAKALCCNEVAVGIRT